MPTRQDLLEAIAEVHRLELEIEQNGGSPDMLDALRPMYNSAIDNVINIAKAIQ